MAQPIKAEELSAWMTPATALALAKEALGGSTYVAADGLIKRLTGGLINAGAATIVLQDNRIETTGENLLVPKVNWSRLSGPVENHSFWRTGDDEIWLTQNVKVTYYGLRFDPKGVNAWLAQIGRPALPVPVPATQDQEAEDEVSGPPVSPSALAAWYEVYRQVYRESEDTEAKAVASARGCFPGKSVSREAVRNLRGAQKRGRKSEPAK